MSLLLDHIVIRVQDLEQTIGNYSSLDFTVQRGGTHANGATHNALIGFGHRRRRTESPSVWTGASPPRDLHRRHAMPVASPTPLSQPEIPLRATRRV